MAATSKTQISVCFFLSVVLPVVDGVQYKLYLSFFTYHMCLKSAIFHNLSLFSMRKDNSVLLVCLGGD